MNSNYRNTNNNCRNTKSFQKYNYCRNTIVYALGYIPVMARDESADRSRARIPGTLALCSPGCDAICWKSLICSAGVRPSGAFLPLCKQNKYLNTRLSALTL